MNAKQKLFADEYLIDMNVYQAAIRAGYSENYAKSKSYKLLENVGIQEYIQKRLAEKEEALIAKQDEVLKYLTSVMRREKKENVVVTVTKKVSKYQPDENGKMRKVTVEESVPKTVEIDTKVSDANKAAELLGKRYGLWDKEIEDKTPPVFNINIVPATDGMMPDD